VTGQYHLPSDLPIAVIGAGAAGAVAAIFAAGGPRKVLLLERTRDGGRKILVSGGGRCNVLPSELAPARFVTESSPNTLRKMLLSWPLAEQRRFFEEDVGIPLALEEETGKLFPVSNQARDVRDGLLRLAARRGVETVFDADVEDLFPSDGSWVVRLQDAKVIRASAVILATGGLSLPGTGSDGTGLRIVRRLGHTIHETYPALTPLTADPPRHKPLAGISLEVTLEAGKLRTGGGFLFTHRGYSGPTVLDASHLAVRSKMPIHVSWTPAGPEEWDRRLREGTGTVATPVRRALPDRLADMLLAEAGVDPGRPLPQLRREERRKLVDLLTRYPLPWTGDEGYRKAEVTGGGVALSEVDARTLQSRLHPGLFLCGEILDAFGPIGGHNFAWAWATGRAAGMGSGLL
jgi:predicted Rossmann fold flavoprotein